MRFLHQPVFSRIDRGKNTEFSDSARKKETILTEICLKVILIDSIDPHFYQIFRVLGIYSTDNSPNLSKKMSFGDLSNMFFVLLRLNFNQMTLLDWLPITKKETDLRVFKIYATNKSSIVTVA